MLIQATVKRSLALLFCTHLLLDFFTGIWPIYKTMAEIDLAKAGLIAGISGFIGEFLQIFFGYFSDRGHRKKILMLGLLLSSCILWITFTDGILSSFFILLLLMLGSGAFHPAGAGLAGFLSPQQKGRNILFFACGGAVGLAFSQLAFTRIFSHFNGHALVLFLPVLVMLVILALYRLPEQQENRKLSLREFFQPLKRVKGPLTLLYITQVFNFTLITAFIFLLPDLMNSREAHSWLCMGGAHLSFILGGALAMIPAGYLCDRYGPKSVLLSIIFLACFLLYNFLYQPSLSSVQTALFLASLGAAMATINPILVSWGNKLVPESPSTVSGLLMGFAWCLSNFGATWAGLIAKSASGEPISTTLKWLGLLLGAGFLLILCMPQMSRSLEAEELK